jgi:hypothetical protein
MAPVKKAIPKGVMDYAKLSVEEGSKRGVGKSSGAASSLLADPTNAAPAEK